MAAKIITVRILVLGDFTDDQYQKWERSFELLDCEFSDYIPKACLNHSFLAFVARESGIEVDDFDAIQSIA